MSEYGKIIEGASLNVQPHERETAKALACAGYTVEFIRKSEVEYIASADVLIDGIIWEMKAPKSSNMKAVQRNIHKAIHQSQYVIFDCRRMKSIPGNAIERECRSLAPKFRNLKRLLFINKQGKVVDIK